MKTQLSKTNAIFAIALVLFGVLFRTVWHLGPNVEFVTAASLLAGAYLRKKWAIAVPLVTMFISDLIIGNTNIFIFTWSAYFVIGCLGCVIRPGGSGRLKVFTAAGLGIVSSFWFYLWTNFGVWLLDSWGMYPKTVSGLINCYLLALPFLKYNLLGNIIFVPSVFILAELVKNHIWNMKTYAIRNDNKIKSNL